MSPPHDASGGLILDPFYDRRTDKLRTEDNLRQLIILINFLETKLNDRHILKIDRVSRSLELFFSTNSYKNASGDKQKVYEKTISKIGNIAKRLKELKYVYNTATFEIVENVLYNLRKDLVDLQDILYESYA